MFNRRLSLALLVGALTTGCSDVEPPYLMAPAPLQPLASEPAPEPAPEPEPEPEPEPVTPADVAGTWYSRIEKNAVNCNAGEFIDGQTIVITQDDTEITMLASTGDMFVGTVNGDIVEWSGSYPEHGGMSDFTSATLVFSADSGAGNAAWTWSNGTESCNGTMAISAERDAAIQESDSNSRPKIADPFEFVDNVAFFKGSLGVGIDRDDYYTFTATSDAVVQAELSHFDTLSTDLDLILLDEGLVEIAISSYADRFEMIDAPVQAGVKYYIKVESRSISGPQSYNLTVDIN